MGWFDFMKGWLHKLFPVKDIRTALNIKVALSQEMLSRIEFWQRCYSGDAPWLDDAVQSLRLERSVTREFANIVLNEMTASVSDPKLDIAFQNALRDINMYLQDGLATGAMIIKPIGTADKVQYIAANAFIPVEYDVRGRLLKVVFPEFKQKGERYYTRLEYHDLDPQNGLTITNKAYCSSTRGALGREIELDATEEWRTLLPRIRYPDMKRPAFGYYRNPIKNNIDGSHCGVSIFESALQMIQKTDVQFGRLDWEFASGERVIHVDEAALRPNGTLPKLNKRLYRGLDLATENGGELYKEFSPALRQADFISGLDEYKRNIEFAVGLAYGDISNPQTVEKTATEVKAAKQRKYNTVTAIQKNLRDCLEDLVYALAFYSGMANSGYNFACDFKDSILTDEDTERQRDIQDLNLGILRPEEYRAKWYGEEIEAALKNLPQSAEVIE